MGLDQTVSLICAMLLAVCLPYVLIDAYGGWAILLYDLRLRFRRKK